jgi:membrane-bound ClpP family serine protease
MTAIVLLFIVGTLLLAGEVLLPGGIVGVLGGIALVAGCWIAFSEFGPGTGILATTGAAALVATALYLEVIWLPRTRVGRRMVVETAIDSQSQPPLANAADVVGRTAVALTTLSPSGYVSVEGKRYEAFCRSGQVSRGTSLSVVGVNNFQLIVAENKSS